MHECVSYYNRYRYDHLPRSDYTRVERGHDQELDMDMEYDSPPTSLMEAMARAGIKISLGSSSTSTSTAVYDDTNDPTSTLDRLRVR